MAGEMRDLRPSVVVGDNGKRNAAHGHDHHDADEQVAIEVTQTHEWHRNPLLARRIEGKGLNEKLPVRGSHLPLKGTLSFSPKDK